jgi:hypothetical protein
MARGCCMHVFLVFLKRDLDGGRGKSVTWAARKSTFPIGWQEAHLINSLINLSTTAYE